MTDKDKIIIELQSQITMYKASLKRANTLLFNVQEAWYNIYTDLLSKYEECENYLGECEEDLT